TLPEGFSGSSKAAAIRICGSRVLVSNRGCDSIAVFALDEKGVPKRRQIVATGGKSPRDFDIFGDYVVAANQDSDELTVLKFDAETGLPEQTGISVPMVRPVCICRI
ncbi:MAG: lactonase family protein, partial [Lachnospiraceae bacterium]|nr:lactonase family protein [Lachnospiraceae bacterium]